MTKGLTKQQIEILREYGCYSEGILADTLSELLGLEELFGDFTISEAISLVYEELAKMREEKQK